MDHANKTKLRNACRMVAGQYHGAEGLWAYDEFDRINEEFFGGRLPPTLISWGLTAHGACVGMTHLSSERAPVITLHQSLLGGSKRTNPWGVSPRHLGSRFALDTLIHECIHVNIGYVLGGYEGPTSHNNPVWVAEVNRLAPLLGFEGVTATVSKTRRKGKQVFRGTADGAVPFEAVAGFPRGLRYHLKQAERYYTDRT